MGTSGRRHIFIYGYAEYKRIVEGTRRGIGFFYRNRFGRRGGDILHILVLVEPGRGSRVYVEFLQVKSILPFPYVVFGNNVGAAFQRKIAGGPFIFRRFFQSVFNDLGAAFSSGAYIKIIIYARVGRMSS